MFKITLFKTHKITKINQNFLFISTRKFNTNLWLPDFRYLYEILLPNVN